MPLGVYISVPFCRSKCSYCNFSSGVFAPAHLKKYADRLCQDIVNSPALAAGYGAAAQQSVDSIYLGGGTPTLLPPAELTRVFAAIRDTFDLQTGSEITVECAPGTLTQPILEALVSNRVNRVSLGVQSFVDSEAASVARLHTQKVAMEDIRNLRAAGITNINIDLIAGLPHQTAQSWLLSLDQLIAAGAPHASVYMLEVDEDSRLGRELIAGGAKYHAHFVPDEDLIAGFYETACEKLNHSGIIQYEISNFALAGSESRHNQKYWTRDPYLGFGVDAHSMLPAADANRERGIESIRLAAADSLEEYLLSPRLQASPIRFEDALEESFFLGLRLNRGVILDSLARRFGDAVASYVPAVEELIVAGLLSRDGVSLQLTPRGRLLSNEVFEKFLNVRAQEPAGDCASR